MAKSKTHPGVPLVCAFFAALGFSVYARAVDFAGGTGEPDDPYQIATAEQLIALGQDPNLYDKHFVLTAEIDLGNVEFTNAVIGTFKGTINGAGHVIDNLTIHGEARSDHVGLFRSVDRNARVENVRLENVYVEGDDEVGALAGENLGTIARCHVAGIVRGERNVGGLVGSNGALSIGRAGTDVPVHELPPPDAIAGLIFACAAEVEVSGELGIVRGRPRSSMIGGLVGLNTGGMIYACRCAGEVCGEMTIGGLVGANAIGWIRSSYAENRVRGGSYIGCLTGGNDGDILFCYATGPLDVDVETEAGGLSAMCCGSTYLSYWDVQTTGATTSYGGKPRNTDQMKNRKTFRGWGYDHQWVLADGQDYPRLAWEESPGVPLADDPLPFESGSGMPEDPYEIWTADQFLALGYTWPLFGHHFALRGDIDLSELDPNATAPIGTRAIPFSGSFAGDGHTITSFRLHSFFEDDIGVFGHIKANGVVNNLVVSGADVRGHWHVGAVAGYNQGNIWNCRADGYVWGDRQVGGIAGANEDSGTVISCMSAGEVVGESDAGGLVGSNDSEITACCSSATVTTTTGHAAGLVAINGGIISSSCATGTISGSYGVGGLVGWNEIFHRMSYVRIGEVLDCYSTASVTGEVKVGGLIGSNVGTVRRCYSAGIVSFIETGGGFVAFQDDDPYPPIVEACYWDTEASGAEVSAAGIARTTEQMYQRTTFGGWDFDTVWTICDGNDYPRLWWEKTQCQG